MRQPTRGTGSQYGRDTIITIITTMSTIIIIITTTIMTMTTITVTITTMMITVATITIIMQPGQEGEWLQTPIQAW